jgi:hypothetical protein
MMTLKNGKFWKNGSIVHIEHGNKEQIYLLDKVSKLMDVGILARVYDGYIDDQNTSVSFKCVCGTDYRKEFTSNEFNQFTTDIFKCASCDLEYIIDGEEYEPFVVVKLKNKRKK